VLVLGCSAEAPDSPPEEGPTETAAEATAKLTVFTVNYPLYYFAERLGGDLVAVSFPAPADEDPAYWAPSPEIVAQYQQADLILLNGVSYAKWLERASLPVGRTIYTSSSFKERWIPLEEGPVHSHGPEGEHSHKGYAFTTWLDLELAAEQARAVAAALIEALPQHQAQIEAELETLLADLVALDRELIAVAERIGDQPVLVSHPVYQYLVARYGLNARSVHWEPDEPPTAEQWQELEELLDSHPAGWMIWEAAPDASTVTRLGDLGLQSAVFRPCGNRPPAGDLLSVMRGNVAAMASIAAPE
jgi:zinc transport system substrate-binding protein